MAEAAQTGLKNATWHRYGQHSEFLVRNRDRGIIGIVDIYPNGLSAGTAMDPLGKKVKLYKNGGSSEYVSSDTIDPGCIYWSADSINDGEDTTVETSKAWVEQKVLEFGLVKA